MAREPTVLHLQPDDVLLIGNADAYLQNVDEFVGELKTALPSVSKVFVFGDDIDVKLLREVEGDG